MKKGIASAVTVIVVVAALLLTSCNRSEGEFALKRPLQDVYRKITGDVEVKTSESVQWVYKFKGSPSATYRIGVLLMKKEIVWVELLATREPVGPDNKIVYGIIEDLPIGEYKILLTDIENTRLIDSLEFTVINPDDEDDSE